MPDLLRLLTLIWTYLLQVIAGQITLVQAINRLYDAVTGADFIGALAGIQSDVTTIKGELQDSGHGLQAIVDKLDLLTVNDTLSLQTVLDAVNPVTLPASPPAGYGGASAAAIWAYVNGSTPAPGTYQVGAQLAEAWGVLTELYRSAAWRVNGNPFFAVEWPGAPITYLSTVFAYPTPDFSRIGSYSNVVDWLNGTDTSGRSWAMDDTSGLAVTYDTLPGEQWYAIRCLLRDSDLYPTAGIGAPIWPGQANVVDGTPVVVTSSDEVAGPMDGVKVTIDSVEAGSGQYGAGALTSYYRAGYLIFLSAEGHADDLQFLGPDDDVYVPKGMVQAGSVVVILNKATQVTVTPWVKA